MKKNGFTLMEVLIAAALIGLVVITAVAIHLAANTFFQSSTSQTKSQDEAAIIMERILRDIRRGYDKQFTFNKDGITIYIEEPDSSGNFNNSLRVKYRLYGNDQLKYWGPTTSPGWGGGQVISTKITDLNFLEVPDFTNPSADNRINVQVQLTAQDQGESTSLDSTGTCLYRPVQYPWE